ncbi:hypothetical protein HK405_010686, partial [Cladochytrium tenue]
LPRGRKAAQDYGAGAVGASFVNDDDKAAESVARPRGRRIWVWQSPSKSVSESTEANTEADRRDSDATFTEAVRPDEENTADGTDSPEEQGQVKQSSTETSIEAEKAKVKNEAADIDSYKRTTATAAENETVEILATRAVTFERSGDAAEAKKAEGPAEVAKDEMAHNTPESVQPIGATESDSEVGTTGVSISTESAVDVASQTPDGFIAAKTEEADKVAEKVGKPATSTTVLESPVTIIANASDQQPSSEAVCLEPLVAEGTVADKEKVDGPVESAYFLGSDATRENYGQKIDENVDRGIETDGKSSAKAERSGRETPQEPMLVADEKSDVALPKALRFGLTHVRPYLPSDTPIDVSDATSTVTVDARTYKRIARQLRERLRELKPKRQKQQQQHQQQQQSQQGQDGSGDSSAGCPSSAPLRWTLRDNPRQQQQGCSRTSLELRLVSSTAPGCEVACFEPGQHVALESVALARGTASSSGGPHLACTVLVRNLAYDKQVFATHTQDGWRSTPPARTVPQLDARFLHSVSASRGGAAGVDRFELRVPVSLLAAERAMRCAAAAAAPLPGRPAATSLAGHAARVEVQMAVCCGMGGVEHWDNRGGRNHAAVLEARLVADDDAGDEKEEGEGGTDGDGRLHYDGLDELVAAAAAAAGGGADGAAAVAAGDSDDEDGDYGGDADGVQAPASSGKAGPPMGRRGPKESLRMDGAFMEFLARMGQAAAARAACEGARLALEAARIAEEAMLDRLAAKYRRSGL